MGNAANLVTKASRTSETPPPTLAFPGGRIAAQRLFHSAYIDRIPGEGYSNPDLAGIVQQRNPNGKILTSNAKGRLRRNR